jgi:hypothetical protein
MRTKYILVAAALVAALTLVCWMRTHNVSKPPSESTQRVSLSDLTEGEKHIYGLLHEVQGHAILTESFVREDGDVKAQLTFDTNKTAVSSLEVNLTSLARKQKEEGMSDGALKRGFTF